MSPKVASLMKSSRLARRLDIASMWACGMLAVLEKGFCQGIRQDLDGGVLVCARHADQGQALAQTLQQPRQLLDHQRAIAAIGLGAGRPHQVGRVCLNMTVSACCAPSRTADSASTSAQVLNRNSRISSRTGISRSMVRSSNGVLDGQRLALLYLLGHADQT